MKSCCIEIVDRTRSSENRLEAIGGLAESTQELQNVAGALGQSGDTAGVGVTGKPYCRFEIPQSLAARTNLRRQCVRRFVARRRERVVSSTLVVPREKRDVRLGSRRQLFLEASRGHRMQASAIALEHLAVRDVSHDGVHEPQSTIRIPLQQLAFAQQCQRLVDLR